MPIEPKPSVGSEAEMRGMILSLLYAKKDRSWTHIRPESFHPPLPKRKIHLIGRDFHEANIIQDYPSEDRDHYLMRITLHGQAVWTGRETSSLEIAIPINASTSFLADIAKQQIKAHDLDTTILNELQKRFNSPTCAEDDKATITELDQSVFIPHFGCTKLPPQIITKNPRKAEKMLRVQQLQELRDRITSEQCALLDEIWNHFLSTGEWPIAWEIHSPNRKIAIRNALKTLNSSIVFESSDSQHGSRYQLTLLGVILTTNGKSIEELLVRYLEFLRKRYQTSPKNRTILSSEVQNELGINDEQTILLGRVVIYGNLFSSSASHDPKGISKDWSAGMLFEVENFPFEGGLEKELEELLLKRFDTHNPVFLDEQTHAMHPQTITKGFWTELEHNYPMTESASMPKTTKLIFVSHSNFDKDVADVLVDMLCTALNLRVADFLCTSVDGAKLRGGDQTDEVLRRTIRDVPAFLSILTPKAIASTYVLFELGARWGAEKHHIPLVAKGDGKDILKDPLKATNALDLSHGPDVLQLVGDLAEALGRQAEPPQNYHQKMETVVRLSHAKEVTATPPVDGFEFRRGLYYKAGDGIPFCPYCWEANKIKIHLSGPVQMLNPDIEYWECHSCNKDYSAKTGGNFLARKGRNIRRR